MTSSSFSPEIYIGDLRIQILSDYLIRFERADRLSFDDTPVFEDQLTFHIVSRFFAMPSFRVRFLGNRVIATSAIEFDLPLFLKKVEEIRFRCNGRWFHIAEAKTVPADLPEPGKLPDYWLLADYPRLVPPEFGATAPPPEYADDMLSGWQISDTLEDFYIFFPRASGYRRFRRELVDLTGQVPMLPKHVLGFIYSRYHAFSDSDIFELVRQYRVRRMPIDMFVVDTDWREGGSTGYEVNHQLFPDLGTFFKIMHDKNIALMFNDHPEPFDHIALSPLELQSREKALGSLLKIGLDSWWYDRNWKTALDEPAPGLGKDVWGMRLFYEITQKCRPLQRVMIMANVPGIKNGERLRPTNIAAHRYPIWWTGDTQPEWLSLQRAVENAVNEAIKSLLCMVSDDIGGHFGEPDAELMSRYIQFGCFSPVFRLHCTSGQVRDPWHFNEEVERVMGNYLGLRLKLLPTLYAALRQVYENTEPMLQRCDLEWPEYAEAAWPHQYLFASQLLVAPIFKPVKKYANAVLEYVIREVWIPPGVWHDVWTGKLYQGPSRKFLRCHAWITPIFARDGAIIVSQPEIVNTRSQSWQSLVLDVFVPERSCTCQQEIYEDDGISNDHLEGIYSTTSIRIGRRSGQVELEITPPAGEFVHAFSRRSWLVRLHFSKFSRMASICLNGNFLLPDRYHFVKRVERPASLPFICRPGYTGKESGETVEIPVENYDLAQPLKITLTLA